MEKEQREIFNIFDKIYEKVDKLDWKCVHKNCNESSINSHLLQQNGILDLILENGHLHEFTSFKTYKALKYGHFNFKLTGIKSAISIPLFCQDHDRELFKMIEINNIDFNDYKTQMLFSYRALCGEIRRKEFVVETDGRVLNSKKVLEVASKEYLEEIEINVESSKIGIKDLSFFKEEFERNLENDNLNLFKFKVFKYSYLEVCTSAIFTPVNIEIPFLTKMKFLFRQKPWECIIINIIPQIDGLYIIAGYHKDFETNWIKNYINSLNITDKSLQQRLISNLFATRINTWAISTKTFHKIKESKKKLLLKYWEENFNNLSENQYFDENLFD